MYKSFAALSLAAALVAGCASPPPPRPPAHPAYLHAMSDLRAARWLLEHRPADWAQTADEVDAIHQIDAALNDMRQAAIEDGKNPADHPPVDERTDRPGRFHEAIDYLRRARADVEHGEEDPVARDLRNRSINHIDAAIGAVRRALHE